MFIFRGYKSLLILMLLLSVFGCNIEQNPKISQDIGQLKFNGEGDIWELSNYNLAISSNSFVAGNGELSMKNTNKYFSDFFSFEVHAEINQDDEIIQKSEIHGVNNDIAFKNIGKISGNPYLDLNGEPLTSKDFNNLYVIIEWKDSKGNNKKELIDLNLVNK